MILLKLFFVFFRVGLFAIGGAYSFLPLIEKEVVQRYYWLTKEEFLEVLAIVKVFPGAISIKYATYTGYKVAGVLGAIMANLGNLLAPMLFIFFASVFYLKYKNLAPVKNALSTVQLVIFAMIISLAFQVVNLGQLIKPTNMLIVLISFILFLSTKIHPALIIIGAGLLGIFLR